MGKAMVAAGGGNSNAAKYVNQIWSILVNTNTVVNNFAYSGSVATYNVPVDGIYKLEVWGASGGKDAGSRGGLGGYSVGYKMLTANTQLFVCVGGQGSGSVTGTGGGYNGGGNAGTSGSSGAGGGCTSISLMTGTLQSIGEANKDKVLIVAGGGGGEGGSSGGGAGGGLTGQDMEGKGGTQTAGGTGGTQGSFGKGANKSGDGGGGGGGWYGGGSGTGDNRGGGGSGYIDGCPEFTYDGTTYLPSTTQGGNTTAGHGKAVITVISLVV